MTSASDIQKAISVCMAFREEAEKAGKNEVHMTIPRKNIPLKS